VFVVVMKFLIIQKVKREIPLEKWAKLLPLQFKYFEKLEKENVLEVYYHLIGQQGSMLVVNVESDEQLSRIIGQDPMFFHLEREIYPLTTRQTHEKQIRQLLKE
jgi:muconolactone delta-isomerase